MLDKGSEEIIKHILAKDPRTIDELDRDYLTARRSYLTEAQAKQFGIKEPSKKEKEADPDSMPIEVPEVDGPPAVDVVKVKSQPDAGTEVVEPALKARNPKKVMAPKKKSPVAKDGAKNISNVPTNTTPKPAGAAPKRSSARMKK